MSLLGFSALYQFADQLPAPLPVVAAGGADRTVLEALDIAQRRGWVEPILTGSVSEIRSLAKDLDLDLEDFRLKLRGDFDSWHLLVQAARGRSPRN